MTKYCLLTPCSLWPNFADKLCPSDDHFIESGRVVTQYTCPFFVSAIIPDDGQNKQMKRVAEDR